MPKLIVPDIDITIAVPVSFKPEAVTPRKTWSLLLVKQLSGDQCLPRRSLKEILERGVLMFRNVLIITAIMAWSLIVCAQETTKAPDFSSKDINNRLIRLSDYRGQVVLLNFWGTWCPPCRAEIPELIKLQRDYGECGLRIIGINYPPEESTVVQEFAQSMKINYPLLIGTSDMAVAFNAGTGELPITIIIDRAGMIRERIVGILTPAEFEKRIKPLIGQK